MSEEETKKGISDPELYRRMSEPIPVGQAQEMLQRFWTEVYRLRCECHIRDVHVIVKSQVLFEDGREGEVTVDMHAGSELECEQMTAWALGRQAALRQARIASIVNSSKAVTFQENKP